MPSHVSGELPNAFDRRIAISGEIPLLPLTILFSAWRVTPSAFAASAILRPSGSRQLSRTEMPGCGGFFIGMGPSRFSMIIVVQPSSIVVFVESLKGVMLKGLDHRWSA